MSRLPLSYLPAVLSVCCLLGCGNTDAPARDYGPLLSKLSQGVILPEHRAFANQADELVSTVQALVDDPGTDSLASAQDGWRAARRAYRMLDALHFGPGYSLHISERIDAAPAEPDGIEALVTADDSITDATVANAGGHEKGFLGLEYLLFADVTSSTEAAAPVLSKDDFAARRRELALAMAHELQKSAHQLDDAWEPGRGGYIDQIETAGAGSTEYANQRAAVDDMVGGVSYALEMIVGVRLAMPLGRKSGSGPDPLLDPTRRSDNAIADMQAMLAGITAMYADDGFSSVVHVKSAKLDETVASGLSSVAQHLVLIPAPFSEALVNDTALVRAAFDTGSDLKKTWNTDVSSALGATLKPSDNDGD